MNASDVEAPSAISGTDSASGITSAVRIAYLVYILQFTFPTLVSPLLGVAISYAWRERVRGTWVESHFRWQIETFWRALLYPVAAIVLLALLSYVIPSSRMTGDEVGAMLYVGMFVGLGALLVWYVGRIAKGWDRLHRGEPAG